MKKILLSVFSCLSMAALSFGQGFVSQYGDTAIGTGYGEDVSIHNDITNNSGSTSTYDWKVVAGSFDAGWTFTGVCDNQKCYNETIATATTHTSNPVNDGDPMVFKAVFTENGAVNGSTAWVQANIYPTGSPLGSTKSLTFIITKGTTTSAANIIKSEDNIVVFPNPAKSSVNVVYGAGMDVKNIGIYNLIGKMVSVYKVGSNSAKLDVENLPSGIYFVRLFNSQGKVVGTRKFTRQ